MKNYNISRAMFLLVIAFLLMAITFTSCKITKKNVRVVKRANTALQSSANAIAKKLKARKGARVYYAMLPPVNYTTRKIRLELLERKLAQSLLKKNIYSVESKGRYYTIAQLKKQLAYLVRNGITTANIVRPRYYIQLSVDEVVLKKKNNFANGRITYHYVHIYSANTRKLIYSERRRLDRILN